MEPSIRSLMKAAEDRRLKEFGITPEIVRKFCVKKLRFGWKTQTRTSNNHATAYSRPNAGGVYRIKFNPLSLDDWLREYSPELLELRMIDIMMHEIAHILVRKFMGGKGHGAEWKLWAHLAGFVPFGSQSNHKRNRHAVALHAQHRGGDPTITQPARKKDDVFVPAPKFPPGFAPGNWNRPMHSFRIGQRVSFKSKRGLSMNGMIIRINRKSISVQIDGEEEGRYWRVSPGLLRLEEEAPKPIRTRPDVIMDLSGSLTKDWAKGAKRPSQLVRAGILAGLENPEIVKVLRETFPDYRAYKIACSVYRRELKAKGEIA